VRLKLVAPAEIMQILAAIEKSRAPVELLTDIKEKLYKLIGQEDPQKPNIAQDSFAMDKTTRKMLKRATKAGRLLARDGGGRYAAIRAAEMAAASLAGTDLSDIRSIRRIQGARAKGLADLAAPRKP
jgi:hypothetical protein